jgi:hypothetical protein
MSEGRYADPAALHRAIADRLRQFAHEWPGTQLTDLQRQVAYDRLLARVFGAEPEAWVLKGAVALLARLGGSARHTLDVDLYRPDAGLDEAEAALRVAASVDIADFFRSLSIPAAGSPKVGRRSGSPSPHTLAQLCSPVSTSISSQASR